MYSCSLLTTSFQLHIGWEPGPPLMMFFATLLLLLFPVIPYIGPSQVVWPQGPKNSLFEKSLQRNDVIAYIRVLQLHKWSNKSNTFCILTHSGNYQNNTLGLTAFWFSNITLSLSQKTKTNCHQRRSFSNISLSISLHYEKLPTFESFNWSPRWPFCLEDYTWCDQTSPVYLK